MTLLLQSSLCSSAFLLRFPISANDPPPLSAIARGCFSLGSAVVMFWCCCGCWSAAVEASASTEILGVVVGGTRTPATVPYSRFSCVWIADMMFAAMSKKRVALLHF